MSSELVQIALFMAAVLGATVFTLYRSLRGGDRKWMLAFFFFSGVLSFFSLFVAEDVFSLEGAGTLSFVFAVYAALLVTGLLLHRDLDTGRAFAAVLVSGLPLVLLLAGFLTYSAYGHATYGYMAADRVERPADGSYLNVTDDRVQNVSELSRLLTNCEAEENRYCRTRVSPSERKRIRYMLDEAETRVVRVNGTYYRITFMVA